jgi:hypothetical protein
MAQRYTAQQLQRIFEKMAGGGGLWVAQNCKPAPYIGPAFAVYLRYSDLFPESTDVADQYWQLLQDLPVVNAIGVLAAINRILTLDRSDRSVNEILQQQFVEPRIADLLRQNAPQPPAFAMLFHRLGSIVAMRDLLLYGANRNTTTDAPVQQIGLLALCANEFVGSDPALTPAPTNLEIAVQVIRSWDIYNPRDLAYALARMHQILARILPGKDSSVTALRDRIGMNNLTVDGLALSEFVAIAFAIFAYGNAASTESMSRVILEPAGFVRDFSRAQPLLDRFLAGRALTVEQLTRKLAAETPATRERFLADTAGKTALKASLSVFRQQPLLRFGDGRVIILDLQFLTDLVTTGVYWLLFDALPGHRRETFRELWGRCFELYVTDLLRQFYPAGAQILSADIEFADGQIDALLDLGPDVFVLEIKSSLLTETAKRSGDPAVLAADIERKFIRNERGDPKAVLQLARDAQAVLRGDVRTAIRPLRVYPVLIADEPGCECLAFNAYLNERFQQEAVDLTRVRPLTVMSVNECEELLPYSAANAFSWAELCESRFDNGQVSVWSVHQAIYDLRHARNVGMERNRPLLDRFDAIYRDILQTYGVDQAVTNSVITPAGK